MKKNFLKLQIISFIVVIIMGTLLHFLYEWSGENIIIGAFSAVNESIWEHLKLIFYPMLLTTILEYFFIKNKKENYLSSKIIGIIIAIILTVVIYYTYIGIIGKNIDWLNIVIFILAIAIGEFVSYKLITLNKKILSNDIAMVIVILLIILFTVFTYNTPQLNIFKDPIDGTYGINKLKY